MDKAVAEPFEVTVDDFDQKVIAASHDRPVMVDFWAEWCPPCVALDPALKQVLGEYAGRVLLGKVEVDDNMKLAGHYQLRGFPTVLLFKDGEIVDRFHGAKPVQFLREFLEPHLD